MCGSVEKLIVGRRNLVMRMCVSSGLCYEVEFVLSLEDCVAVLEEIVSGKVGYWWLG